MEDERDPETYVIIGAAMRVHSELGRGFLENVYHDALEIEFGQQQISYLREHKINVFYRIYSIAIIFHGRFPLFSNRNCRIESLAGNLWP